MIEKTARLKFISQLAYGDALPKDEVIDGDYKVFGSNGPYATINYPNTKTPAIIIGRKGSYGKINWSSEKCFASDTTFYIDETCTNYHLRWLYFVLQTLKLDEGSSEAAVPGLSRNFAYEQKVFVFDINQQLKIAEYLDKETIRIDELIKEKENLLIHLAEKRNAIVTQVVTRGLNRKVQLKDSGIEWLSHIPATWEMKKVKYLTTKVGSGVTPKGGATVYQKVGIPLLRSQNIQFDGLELEDVAFISEDVHESMSNSKVYPGDVLINITGASIGRCYFYSGELGEANVNQHVCILRPNGQVLTEYLYLLLSSTNGQSQVELHQVGGGREGLTFESIKSFVFPLPEIQEQREILKYVNEFNDEIHTLKKSTRKSIGLLMERRSALITAAVTGKLEISL
jgi:type I restriction enzyme S subunit